LFLELNYLMFFNYIYLNIKLGHSDYCLDLDETMFLKLTQSRWNIVFVIYFEWNQKLIVVQNIENHFY